METVKLLHCADIHFDTPFDGFDTREAENRKEDLRETFGRIIRLIKEKNIPLVLMAGDIFDGNMVSKRTVEYMIKKFREISFARIFISPGNHDPYTLKSHYNLIEWPENVHVFKRNLEKIHIPELGCCIYGAAFDQSYQKQSLLKDFKVDNINTVNIMVVHGDVIGNGQSSDYNPIFLEDVKETGLDYLALGHKHSFSGINREGNTYWAYAGNPEGRGFDELGPKGVIMGEVAKNFCNLEFLNICNREYIVKEVDISRAVNYEEIVEVILKSTENLGQVKNIFKVILKGEVHELPISLSVLQYKLQEHYYYIKLEDATRIAINYELLEKEYSLKGIFTRKLREKLFIEGHEEKEITEEALKIGIGVLEAGKVEIE